MEFRPHGYQQRAIDFVMEHERCALFLEMGLGKTVSTLTAVARLVTRCMVERVLVIAPKKVAESTWSDETRKWDHLQWLRVSTVMGTQKQRETAIMADAHIYVIGRDSTVWLEQWLKDHRQQGRFDMVVIDELTSFKNSRSLRFKALRRMLPGITYVVGLTGTPTPNGLIDLWGQIYCIDQGERLGRFVTHYRDKYFHCVKYNNIVIKVTPRQGAYDQIMDAISDITLTMRAEDYVDLPPITITDFPVCLPDRIMKDYRKFEREQVTQILSGQDPKTITAESAGALINKLSQFANGAVYDEGRNVIGIHTEKVAALMEILESEDSPLLCFYAYRHDIDRIMDAIPKGTRARVYHDAADLRAWNAGEIDLLLAHPASTAFGLNMQQGGSRIAWYGTGWNLELYQQANARLHRQGQTRPVRVFNLIARDTIDERMAAAIRGKAEDQAGVVKRLAQQTIKAYV